MPKRKQHKIKKKKKSKSKQQKENNNKYNICIPLCLPTDCKDRVEINAKSKGKVLFVIKSKHCVPFITSKASSILWCLDNSRKRWDIICNIASWCNSFNLFNKTNIDNNTFWSQYIETMNKNNKPIPDEIISMIIERIKDIFKECIESKYYYSRDNWDEKRSKCKLADFELELVAVGYFRNNVKKVNNYYIPMDIISLFSSYYGHLSDYLFDTDQNILFVSTNPEQRKQQRLHRDNSPFVCIGQYAIYKKGFELNSIDRTEFKFSAKMLKSNQIFGIGIAIYNEEMSDNLRNDKWKLNKDKYLQSKDYITDNEVKYLDKSNKNEKWDINDICTLVVSFGQNCVTEYTANWLLSIGLYKNNDLIHRAILVTHSVHFQDKNRYQDVKRVCHVVFDNQPLSTTDTSLFSLQLMKSIDSSIIDAIEWWRNLNVGDRIFCVVSDVVFSRCEIKSVGGENNNLLTLQFGGGGNEYFEQIYRRNPRIVSDVVFYRGLCKIKRGGLLNVFGDEFQFVAIIK